MEFFDAIVKWVEIFPQWVQSLMGLVTAATAITAITPTKWDNQLLDGISKVLNALAGNIGKNKNADA